MCLMPACKVPRNEKVHHLSLFLRSTTDKMCAKNMQGWNSTLCDLTKAANTQYTNSGRWKHKRSKNEYNERP